MAPIIETTPIVEPPLKGAATAAECITEQDLESKPLPQLIQQVLEDIQQEEDRLKQQEALAQKLDDVRFTKSLPLEHDAPVPPPKEEPARLSLEEDYPNRTVDLEEIVSKEYRERANFQGNQWYFDEFAGIYRQNAPGLWGCQSMPSLQSSSSKVARSLMQRKTTLQSHAASPLMSFRLSGYEESVETSSVRSGSMSFASTSAVATTTASSSGGDTWPSPRTVDEVHHLRKQARATCDRHKQLDLCRTLMDAACRGETEHMTASPIPGTPPVNTRYRKGELRRKKKKDLLLDQVLVLEAQKILKRLALGGGGIGYGTDGDAQYLLATCYGVGGLGLPLNRERAFALYIHASKQNHVESSYRAGVCYEVGIGTRKDYVRAMTFYRKAATQSHVASMYKLGVILLRGYCGQTINVKEALTWLQRAAALANEQDPHALYALAILQLSEEFAEDTIVDTSYALELLHRSAKMGYLPSQVKLGELYEMGGGGLVEVDDALSIYWYTQAAEKGSGDAALALSSWYLTGSSGVLGQSDQEAYLWARKAAACQTTDRWTLAKSYFLVGMYVEKGIGISDTSTEDALVWFQRSAVLGHLGAMQRLENTTTAAAESSMDL